MNLYHIKHSGVRSTHQVVSLRVVILVVAGGGCWTFHANPTSAQDSVPQTRFPSEISESTLSDALDAARSASQHLSNDGLSQEVINAQAEVIAKLRLLLGGENATSRVDSPETTELPNHSQSLDQSSNRDGSQSGVGGGTDVKTVRPNQQLTRRDLTDSVWGHLPVRERQDLSRTYSEQYLPGYEERVRQYFERLSRRRPVRPDQSPE